MDDTRYGTRDKRGDWRPYARIEFPPVFVWPMQAARFARWIFGFPGYFLPWNCFYAIVSLGLWQVMPSVETMKTFALPWVAYLLALNAAMVFLFYGALHFRLYIQKRQGKAFKYNAKWPSTNNSAFLFGNQTKDNIAWTFLSAIPIVTAYQAIFMWAFANGYIKILNLDEYPFYFIILMILIPAIGDVHFYLIHRLIHWPPLYHSVHKLHHNNVNPGPWSGLAMHPVEHLLYFSCVLMYLIVPTHPVHVVFHLLHNMLSPAPGHAGYDKVLLGDEVAINTDGFAHYLHHKYFECNYADGVVPLDRWFGSFHNGSPESQAQMDQRFLKRAARRAEAGASRGQG
jgi:sterol desaturase/sphingolipid hydroxylase (fatty acid hydroxylase superfamily)